MCPLYGSDIIRALGILGLLAAIAASFGEDAAATATAQRLPVVVVPGLELDDLEPLSRRGAIGLLVPAAGPRTSAEAAAAALERGRVRNSLRGGLPEGPRLIAVERRDRPPLEGPAIVLGLPRGGDQPNDRRYPIAVLGADYSGLLKSSSTRIPGIVSIVDVAPTALGAENRLESRPAEDAVPRLRELDERIDENNSTRALVSLVVWVAICALALVFPRAAVIAFGAVLTASLALGVAGISTRWAVVTVLVLAVLCLAPLLAFAARSPEAVAVVGVAAIAGYFAAFAADGRWIALSPLGPTQNARFYGLSNLLETFMLVPAFFGAALLARRRSGLFAAVAVLAVVTVAGSRFGADGGGAIVLAAGYAALAALLARSRRRALLSTALGFAIGVGLVFLLDELTGASSHVTRTIRGGPDDLAEAFWDRITLSWARATDRVSTALIVTISVVALALLVVRLLGSGASARRAAIPLATVVAVATSLVVNDSPVDVAVTGLVAYLALEAYTVLDVSAAGTLARHLGLARNG
jgi:hypothetical protein